MVVFIRKRIVRNKTLQACKLLQKQNYLIIFAKRNLTMEGFIGIEAIVAWALLLDSEPGILREPAINYNYGIEVDGLGAEELFCLLKRVRRRLHSLGYQTDNTQLCSPEKEPERLFINRDYVIRLGSWTGPEVRLRPLVKTVFIFFLKHPEGILLKERAEYEPELRSIYAIVAPNVSREDQEERIHRLVSLEDNSFSEKCSVLNASLERVVNPSIVEGYKVQGTNGSPRRIPISPLMVYWM